MEAREVVNQEGISTINDSLVVRLGKVSEALSSPNAASESGLNSIIEMLTKERDALAGQRQIAVINGRQQLLNDIRDQVLAIAPNSSDTFSTLVAAVALGEGVAKQRGLVRGLDSINESVALQGIGIADSYYSRRAEYFSYPDMTPDEVVSGARNMMYHHQDSLSKFPAINEVVTFIKENYERLPSVKQIMDERFSDY